MIFGSRIDYIKDIYQFGMLRHPEKMPKYNGNKLKYSRDLEKSLKEIYPLYIKQNNNILLFN